MGDRASRQAAAASRAALVDPLTTCVAEPWHLHVPHQQRASDRRHADRRTGTVSGPERAGGRNPSSTRTVAHGVEGVPFKAQS